MFGIWYLMTELEGLKAWLGMVQVWSWSPEFKSYAIALPGLLRRPFCVLPGQSEFLAMAVVHGKLPGCLWPHLGPLPGNHLHALFVFGSRWLSRLRSRPPSGAESPPGMHAAPSGLEASTFRVTLEVSRVPTTGQSSAHTDL
jgi:hypothetical protein